MTASLQPEEFDLMTSLGDVPRHHARTRGDKVALSFEGRETTFAALDANSNRTSAALTAAGVKAGDRGCYFGKNSDHYCTLLFGGSNLGAGAAAIVDAAADRSLVLMDEIGRGTSVFDGLSQAHATASRLIAHNRAFTLFATHYFELTRLAQRHAGVFNRHLAAVEHRGGIAFLHEVRDGPANRSYGLQVARLAGLPGAVVRSAGQMLEQLELQARADDAQIDLFGASDAPDAADAARADESAHRPPGHRSATASDASDGSDATDASDASDATDASDSPDPSDSSDTSKPSSQPDPRRSSTMGTAERAVLDRLASLSPDELTPRAALELLYEWRARLNDD